MSGSGAVTFARKPSGWPFYSEYVSAHLRGEFPGLVSYMRLVDYIPQYYFVRSYP